MDMRRTPLETSGKMSVGAEPRYPGPTSRSRQTYPLRVLARIFGVFGIATTVYAVALVAVAVQSSIIEF